MIRSTRAIDLSEYAKAAEIEIPQYVQPPSGDTINIDASTTILVVEPSVTLATLIVNLPAVPARGNGHKITVLTSQIVTALTLGAGAGNTLLQAITTLAANGFFTFVYRANKWYRCG